jgi:hypothetical protein
LLENLFNTHFVILDFTYKMPLLLPEWELVTEPEPDVLQECIQEKSTEDQLRLFQELVQKGQAGSLHGKIIIKTVAVYLTVSVPCAIINKL